MKTGSNIYRLFMDRFKSIATQEQNSVQELVRYIHLNPVRAGICKDLAELEKYPWCGHGGLAGHNKIAAKEYRAPLQIVAEYLGVGRTGASALSRQGRNIAKRMKVII